MAASQMLTLILGLALAAGAVYWAVMGVGRNRKADCFLLISSPHARATLRPVLTGLTLLVLVVGAVFAFDLIPQGMPLVFAATLGWITTAFVAFIVGAIAAQLRSKALGWLTLIGKDKLQLDAHGSTMALTLVPGAARLYPVDGAPECAQFVITDGTEVITVWGLISASGLEDVTEDAPLKPQGLMLAGSAEPLRRWLSPYIERHRAPVPTRESSPEASFSPQHQQ